MITFRRRTPTAKRMPTIAAAGYPRGATLRRTAGGSWRWTIVTSLQEFLAGGTERTRPRAVAAGVRRRLELIEALRTLPEVSIATRADIQPTCCRERRSLDLLK